LFFFSELEAKKNFEEFKLDFLTKEILKKYDLKQVCSFKSKATLFFYNMMIVSQAEQLSLKQNKPFDTLYLVKI